MIVNDSPPQGGDKTIEDDRETDGVYNPFEHAHSIVLPVVVCGSDCWK